jgi:hypothetical protein
MVLAFGYISAFQLRIHMEFSTTNSSTACTKFKKTPILSITNTRLGSKRGAKNWNRI